MCVCVCVGGGEGGRREGGRRGREVRKMLDKPLRTPPTRRTFVQTPIIVFSDLSTAAVYACLCCLRQGGKSQALLRGSGGGGDGGGGREGEREGRVG